MILGGSRRQFKKIINKIESWKDDTGIAEDEANSFDRRGCIVLGSGYRWGSDWSLQQPRPFSSAGVS